MIILCCGMTTVTRFYQYNSTTFPGLWYGSPHFMRVTAFPSATEPTYTPSGACSKRVLCSSSSILRAFATSGRSPSFFLPYVQSVLLRPQEYTLAYNNRRNASELWELVTSVACVSDSGAGIVSARCHYDTTPVVIPPSHPSGGVRTKDPTLPTHVSGAVPAQCRRIPPSPSPYHKLVSVMLPCRLRRTRAQLQRMD